MRDLYREATNQEIIERTDVIYLAVLPVEIDHEAAKRCETCKGTGDAFEEHEFGARELVACLDCRGTGEWCNDHAVRYVLGQALGIGGDDASPVA
jgi:hypothetical protein